MGGVGGRLALRRSSVHTEAVAWVSGCMDVSATVLVLLGCGSGVGAGVVAPRVGATLLWFSALMFKKSPSCSPAVLWATDRAAEFARRTPDFAAGHSGMRRWD